MTATLTIFTPTYQRAHLLGRAYASLLAQTSRDFVWLVIDDGSTDGTAELVKQWQQAAPFHIDYFYQQNEGKHNAHNKAVAHAETELFVIFDSDDELLPNAVADIVSAWKIIGDADRSRIGGVWTLCVDGQGDVVGRALDRPYFDCSLQELRYKHRINQEMLATFSTAVLRRFPFPTTPPGMCPYIPEGYVWMRITRTYVFRFLNVKCRVYHATDGLSVMEQQPYRVGACIVYSYLTPLTYELEWFWSAPLAFLESAIQAARYALFSGQYMKLSGTLPWGAKILTAGALPAGMFLLFRDWVSGRISREVRGAQSR